MALAHDMTRSLPRWPAWWLAAIVAVLLLPPFGMTAGTASATESTHTAGAASAGLSAPYAFRATNRSPLEILRQFAGDHGLSLRFAPAANGRAQAWNGARLDGWIRAESGHDFLEQLANAHRFDWFVANRTLYVSARADSIVERIPLHGISAEAARAALAAVGLYDERFGWGVLAAQDAVLVSGPREYVALVRRFLSVRSAPSAAAARAEPMIFPLRYAPATDADGFDAGDRTRPGAASIIRQLVGRDAADDAPAFFMPLLEPASAAGARQPASASVDGLAHLFGISPPLPALPPLPSSRSPSMRLPATRATAARDADAVVIGDERSNTVIVWGDPALRGPLERIVEALDQPMPMVSMEVLVLETDDETLRSLAQGPAHRRADADEIDTERSRAGFDAKLSHALEAQRAKVLNRQNLVGFANQPVTLALGAEESHRRSPLRGGDAAGEFDDNASGRAGHRGDALDLVARPLPAQPSGPSAIAVDVRLLMAQPTGLPGQEWSTTTSVRLRTAVALEGGGAPRLLTSYPVATSRDRQRAIFISAGAL
ncbi:type II/III secretion system protein [Trinickia symbiotica]|nr:type II/III secretion system protein [Trinickia symbiotica]